MEKRHTLLGTVKNVCAHKKDEERIMTQNNLFIEQKMLPEFTET
jgi:hypothetical protein